MTAVPSAQPKKSLSAKMFLVVAGSCVLYLSLLAAVIAAAVALFGDTATGESLTFTVSRAFLNALYIPTVLILMMLMLAVLAFVGIKLLGTTGGSAKLVILCIAIFVFSVGGSIGPLLAYRPDPTTAYLIVFAALVAISLAFHAAMVFSDSTVSALEKVKRCVLLFPFVIVSVFSAMSLVLAMLRYVNPSTQAEGILKVCSGILMPLWAIASLFIPLVILYLGLDASTKPAQETTAEAQTETGS